MEEDLLRRFRESASREALRDLLVAHQDRIYNACFQVLRRAEDAEDAAQEALLKVAEGARTAADADALRGWVYRVSLRVALDMWRRREATRHRETRAAMNRPATPPLDDRERLALFEAMEGLDDRERALLLEHYFEKVPLAALGDRRGISAVAIWKRIDRAREKLKKSLLGAGITVAAAQVSDALEATAPAAAPSSVLADAALSKILAGGVVMGATKSSTLAVKMVMVALLIVLVGGGLVAVRASKTTPKPGGASDMKAAPAAGPIKHASAYPPHDPEESSVTPIVANPLRETLERYRAWHLEWKKACSQPHDPTDPRRNLRLSYDGFKRFTEARQQIFDDVETFLAFLRDPRNEELLGDLIRNLLGNMQQSGAGGSYSHPQKYGDFPPELMDGMLELLRSPNPAQHGILRLLGSVHDVPEKFDEMYEQLMYSPDTWVQYLALCARCRQRPLDLPTLEKILARYESSADPSVRQAAINVISHSPRLETLRWTLNQLDSGRDPSSMELLSHAAATIGSKISMDGPTMDQLVRILVAAVGNMKTEGEQNQVLWSALYLAPKDSVRILEGALTKVSTPKLKSAIESTMAEAAKGSATANQLQNHFFSRMK